MIGVAVVGAGRIGRLHAQHLKDGVPGAHLACVVDPVQPGADCKTLKEALQRSDVQAVVIASPTDLHAEQIEEAARAGKAIFCEKPVGLELARCEQALEAAQDVPFQIGFQRRYDPGFAQAHQALQAGQLGKLEMLRSFTADPAPPPRAYLEVSGGIFRDMAIHDIDVARFFGGDIVEVSATGACLVDPSIADIPDVDTAVATVRFSSGALGVLQAWRRSVRGYDIRAELMGSGGTWIVEEPGTYDGFLSRFKEAYRRELVAFVEALASGKSPTPGPRDAVESLRVALAAAQSLREGRPVRC